MKTDNKWYDLDNQAIIYPAVSNSKNTNVFRISCTLNEIIDPEMLQQALNKTMVSFPYYKVIIRRGLFWYYLENVDKTPVVSMESDRPCNEIFDVQVKDLLFKVTYYYKRINIEMFHALADGGGAIQLLKNLVYNYILIKHKSEFSEPFPVLEKPAEPASQAEDSFQKYYTSGQKDSHSKDKAFTLGGSIMPMNDVQIISLSILTSEMLSLAKSNQVTLTAYLTALLIHSIESEMLPKRYLHRDISIAIPVDLRAIFPSQSFRNFFSVVDVRYNFSKSPSDFESILKSVSEQISEKITPQNLARMLNYNISAQKNVFARVVPLLIKNIVLKSIFKTSEKTTTATISNVGRVTMPVEMVPYIDSFHCLLNPTNTQRTKLCITSFEKTLVMNFTSRIFETSIQKKFVRHLTQKGINVCITTNGSDKDEIL